MSLENGEAAWRSRMPVQKRLTVILSLVSAVPSLIYASLLPHLFFYLQLLGLVSNVEEPTAHVILGFVVAAFSLTKMVLNPIVGWMSNKLRLRLLLFLSMLCQTIGSIGFAVVRNPWLVIGVYFVLGLAASNSTVCRVYVPRIIHEQAERVQLLAWLTFGTTIGFIAGPALGSLLAIIDCPSEPPLPILVFNGCTSPGWVGAVFGVLGMCLIPLLPEPPSPQPRPQPAASTFTSVDNRNDDRRSKLIFLTLASQQFAVVLPFASIESLTAPICAAAYGWTPKQVGVLFSVGSLVTLPWPFLLKVVLKSNRASPCAILLSSMLGQALSLIFLDDFSDPLQGKKAWLPQFITAFCAYYIFYVVAQTTIFTVFYSLLAEHPNCAVWVGWVSSMGNLGRWIWPVVSVNLFSIGAGIVWLTTAAVVALLGPLVLALNRRHLVRERCSDITEQQQVLHVSVLTSEVVVSDVQEPQRKSLVV